MFVARFDRLGSEGPGMGVHAFGVICLLTEGMSRVRHGGELELRAGDVHLIPPGDPHRGHTFQRCAGWVLAFWPEHTSRAFKLFAQVRNGCHPVFRLSSTSRARVERLLAELERELHERAEGRQEALEALLQLVLVELARAGGSDNAPSTEASGLARKAIEHIELHALGPLSLVDVAGAVSRTPAHVATVVKRQTGRTVGDWILTHRMGEARRRLQTTEGSIEEIARHVGYADTTHFIRQFRRVHGKTPAQWRNLRG